MHESIRYSNGRRYLCIPTVRYDKLPISWSSMTSADYRWSIMTILSGWLVWLRAAISSRAIDTGSRRINSKLLPCGSLRCIDNLNSFRRSNAFLHVVVSRLMLGSNAIHVILLQRAPESRTNATVRGSNGSGCRCVPFFRCVQSAHSPFKPNFGNRFMQLAIQRSASTLPLPCPDPVSLRHSPESPNESASRRD